MNTLLFSFSISALFLAKCCEAEYTLKGDHWGDDTIKDRKEYASAMISEWEDLVARQDAEAMAAKYTEDCWYISHEKGILHGREAIQNAYQEWFDSGTASANVVYLNGGIIDGDHAFLAEHIEFFYNKCQKRNETKALVIFRRVEGGYKTFIKIELND